MNMLRSSETTAFFDRLPAFASGQSGRSPLFHDPWSDPLDYPAEGGTDNSDPSTTVSRFEQIIAATDRISPQRQRLLGLLLSAGPSAHCNGRSVLRPIWADEAMHRAYRMVRLVGQLDEAMPRYRIRSPWPNFESKLGLDIKTTFDSLAILYDEEPRSCSAPLRDIVRDLVELFGPAIGNMTAATSVDHLTLPAFRHRALILLASELVTNAMLHASKDRRDSRIALRLSVLGHDAARLTVTCDGCFDLDYIQRQPACCDVITDLSDLLQGEPICQSRLGGGTIVDLEFPV